MKQFVILLFSFLLVTCASSDESPSGENSILSFELYLTTSFVPGTINQGNGQITFTSVGAGLNGLTPLITISNKATISPSASTMLDFTNPVNYTVTAENGDTKNYTVTVDNRPLNEDSKIITFSFDVDGQTYNCDIDEVEKTITTEVVGLDLSSVIPNITYSDFATIIPGPQIAQNFNNAVSYTVTAENNTTSTYDVIIDNRPVSSENQILSFAIGGFNGIIDEVNKTISINTGNMDISAIAPTINISDYASISPSDNVIQNFNNEVEYTVTAENGETAIYTVSANEKSITTVGPNFGSPYRFFAGSEIFVFGHYINTDITGAELYLSDGVNEYPLDIIVVSTTQNSQNATEYQIRATIENFTPTNSNYILAYRQNSEIIEFNYSIDVLQGGPDNMMLNQTEYNYNDVMIVNGTDLVPGLVVPSNGNQFIIEYSNNYDIQVNPSGTQLTWTLDYHQHFPSYYGDAPEVKKIYTLGEGRRVGKYFEVIFN